MSNLVAWIAAEAERPRGENEVKRGASESEEDSGSGLALHGLVAHQFRARRVSGDVPENPHPPAQNAGRVGHPDVEVDDELSYIEGDPERRAYRGRTVAMLRRYMRYSIETGRLPSLLGKEFFRAKVTAYTVVSFEDRVIFVHDMERCLGRLDEFSQQLIAKHILQEHDRWATARLLHCNEKTVRRCTPMALDLLSEILLQAGLMEHMDSIAKNSCQEGKSDRISLSDCEDE